MRPSIGIATLSNQGKAQKKTKINKERNQGWEKRPSPPSPGQAGFPEKFQKRIG